MFDRLRSCSRNLLVILALACFLGASVIESARAQDGLSDFFGGLFGGGGGGGYHAQPRRPAQPSYNYRPRVRRLMPHRGYGAPAYWHDDSHAKRAKARISPHETLAPREKPPESSFFVVVMGDSLSEMLADGLDEAFEDKPEIAFRHKGKESSGLVRDDFFDWAKAAREMLASQDKVDVAVMMIGSNDRQAIHEGSDTREPLSPRWRELYGARVDAVMSAFREKKIPLIWVGLPVMKADRFSADMAQLNEMFREHAARNGVVFVDIWEAFGDERNQYQSFGPDVNGRIVKLRSADGVHFTDAGARELAYFVEGEIKKLFEGRPQPGEAALPDGGTPSGPNAPQQPATPVFVSPGAPSPAAAATLPDRPAIGPAQSLTSPPAPTDSELARRGNSKQQSELAAQARRALVNHIYVEGREPPPRQGRADDFSWPRDNPAPAPQ